MSPTPHAHRIDIAGLTRDLPLFEVAPGTRIAVFGGQGGLADYGCFPAARAVPLPDAMSFADAAAFQVAYGTSHLALGHRAQLQPGETLLVLGAAAFTALYIPLWRRQFDHALLTQLLAAGLATNATARAISSGVPWRPSAVRLRAFW